MKMRYQTFSAHHINKKQTQVNPINHTFFHKKAFLSSDH
jgi:hypothetical protein